MKERKEFLRKGKVVRLVKAYPYSAGNGEVRYTDNRKVAEAMNNRFGAPVLPARETFEGAA